MAKNNSLPYLTIKNSFSNSIIAKFLLKKIKKFLKKCPYHYLIFFRKDKLLKVIKENSKKYPYFLRFDIEKYYPSIDHQILLIILEKILNSRKGKKFLKSEIIPFLNKYQIQNKGLPLGNFLSYVLAGIYLLPLDLCLIKSKIFFLRFQDDYLIFLKKKKEPLNILKEIIEPTLNNLKVNININKLSSGRFHQDKLDFLGFQYFAGYFTIENERIEEFKNKIRKITHLKNKKSSKAIIKILNNKILGFGHYYKISKAKKDFERLDAFIRQRLRRYLLRNKDSKNKLGNLVLTNESLKSLGLKSLKEIYEKYRLKKRHILRKKREIQEKIDNLKINDFNYFFFKNQDKSLIFSILIKLEEISKKLEYLLETLKRNEKNKKDYFAI